MEEENSTSVPSQETSSGRTGNHGPSRRQTLKGFISGGLAASAIGSPWLAFGASAQSKELLVSMSGGSFMESWQTQIIDPFEKATGANVKLVPGSEKAHAMSLLASSGRPPFDIIMCGGSDYLRLVERKSVQPLTDAKLPNLADIDEKFKAQWDGRGVFFNYGSVGLAYRTDKIAHPPTSWKAFLDRSSSGEFGKYVFFNSFPAGVRGPEVLLTIARALTGDQKNVDAAFDAIKKIRPYVVKFFGSFGDPVTLLLNGEGIIGPGWDGRTYIAHDESKGLVDWVRPDDGVASIGTVIGVAKGGNEDLAYEFLNYSLGAEAQKAFCEKMFYGSVNNKVVYSEALAKRIPPISSANIADERFIAENMSNWIDRWNNEIAI